MGRAPCCDKANVKKGPWSPEEDAKLKEYMEKNGTVGNWITLPQKAGLRRCGKSCRLRWLNYLRPNIRHGDFSDEEDRIIGTLFANIGSRWSIIAAQLPGRTDNDIKNYWNTKLKKKLFGVVQSQRETHQIQHTSFSSLLQSSSTSPSPSSSTLLYNCGNNTYQAPPTSFSSFEPSYFSCFEFEPSSSSSFPNNSAPSLESDESLLGRIKHILLEEGSCSTSSDGSFSNQFSHGKELECSNNGDHQQIGIQSYNNFHSDVSRMLMSMASDGADGLPVHQKSSNGLRAETERTPILDYGIEEIKQLISSTPSTCNSFLFDENKADEKVMYY